ncbi:MAG TPA: hypothetical protein VF720_09800 [Candidatus Eisenbacteria bacterium]
MAKKWYDFFVVTDRPGDPAGGGKPGPEPAEAAGTAAGPSPTSAAPKRAAELAPQSADPAFTAPVADPIAFDEIYAAAQIAPPAHGYSILKVAEMLGSEHLRDLASDLKKRSILVALDAAGVAVDDVVQDAVRRDRALDTYERLLQKSLEELRAGSEAENRRIEDEINSRVAELKTRLEENRRKLREEESGLEAWRSQKVREEARIAEAVGYFVSENPVTTSDKTTPSGGDHVR